MTAPWPAEDVTRFALQYQAASTEVQRRAVCIDAIDKGLIHQGMSIEVIDQIFGTNLQSKKPKRLGEYEWGVIPFRELQATPPPGVSAGRTGWFLAVSFDKGGQVEQYYLTNVHK